MAPVAGAKRRNPINKSNALPAYPIPTGTEHSHMPVALLLPRVVDCAALGNATWQHIAVGLGNAAAGADGDVDGLPSGHFEITHCVQSYAIGDSMLDSSRELSSVPPPATISTRARLPQLREPHYR
jgi:hypothetical protein